MSYGLRYTITFRDEVLSSTLWQVNIYKSGYGGSSTSVTCSDNPITLSYKQQDLISPVMGSELTIGLMSTTNGQFIEFATAAPLQYYVDVKKSTDNGATYNFYWSGVNTTDCYSEPYQNKPYSVNLKFNCGLGELQWHRYENSGNLLSGLEQLAAIFANCLSFLPYTKNIREIINIREDTQLDTLGFLEQTYISDTSFTEIADDGVLHGINCNKLLNQLCTSLNLRIYQSNNMWYVERIYERTTNTMQYFDYTPTGSMELPTYQYVNMGSGTFNNNISINNTSQPKLVDGGDWAVTQKKPALSYNFNTTSLNNVELITNPFFEDTPTGKNINGQPLNWDLGSSLVSGGYPMNIEVVNPYTSDAKYRYGVSFSQQCIADFNSYMNTSGFNGSWTSSSNLSAFTGPKGTLFGNTFLDKWAIRSVRKHGDTYSQPWLYIDPVNGSLNVNLNFYFDFQMYVAQNNYGNLDANAYQMLYGVFCDYYTPIRIAVVNLNTGAEFSIAAALGTSPLTSLSKPGFYTTATSYCFGGLNNNFPDPEFTGQSVALGRTALTDLLYASYQKTFSIKFLQKISCNLGFDTTAMGHTPGVYAFVFDVCPPILFDYSTAGVYGSTFPNTSVTSFVLADFAVNTVDIQYQDSFQGVSGYTKFYQAPDVSNRWNEQSVNVLYGDSLTPGYPGSFRLAPYPSAYNSQPTNSWHQRGQSNPFTFNSSTSGSDPGTGKCSLDNSNPTLAANLYINTTNSSSVNVATWLAAMATSNKIVVSDNTTGAQYIYATGVPVNHTTYYDVPVTFVSGSGTLSNTNVMQIAYQGGQVLADVLFNPYEALISVYRRKITGKIIMNGGIPFWYNIKDEDGTVYAQTGSTFDFKKGMITVNMEEVSAGLPQVLNQFTSLSKTKTRTYTVANTAVNSNTAPLALSKITTPIAKTISLPTIIPYPSI